MTVSHTPEGRAIAAGATRGARNPVTTARQTFDPVGRGPPRQLTGRQAQLAQLQRWHHTMDHGHNGD